ncbi:glycosyltransferase family 39 protein, partial [bacterium]|nr:glycosyltransferase family 39 protein [bacterium]
MKSVATTTNRHIFLILLGIFLWIFIQRSPTFFVDYYEVDVLAAIIQTKQFLAGWIPGVDFAESKLPLYHLVFKLAYKFSITYGWVIVSAIVCCIISCTSYFIYKTGALLLNKRAGIIAALLYGVLVSSFNRHFMAANGEIFFNLPIMISFYFLVLFEKKDKWLYIISSLFFILVATQIKIHAMIMFPFIAFYLVLQRPFTRNLLNGSYLLRITMGLIAVLLLLTIDSFTANKLFPFIKDVYADLVEYATARPFTWINFLLYFGHRILTLSGNHLAIWLPLFVFLYKTPTFYKERSKNELLLFTFFIFTFIPIFIGGGRFYFHYFIQTMPALVLIAGYKWDTWISKDTKHYKKLRMLIIIPSLIYLSWNWFGAYLVHYNNNLFYNEPSPIKHFRLVIAGQTQDSLLPHKAYRDVVDYINNNKGTADKLFVWGNTPAINYFTDLKQGSYVMWHEIGGARYLKDP